MILNFYSDPKNAKRLPPTSLLSPEIRKPHLPPAADYLILSGMNPKEMETIHESLLQRKAELEEFGKASAVSGGVVQLDQTTVGRLSRMDAMQAQQMSLELARRGKLELLQVEGALRRLAQGDYGMCHSCGEDIGIGRLKVNPSTTSCINCA